MYKLIKWFRIGLSMFFFLLGLSVETFAAPLYEFGIQREFQKMKDGTPLAITLYMPVSKVPEERFPVLFELLPYRKDDRFALRDYSLYSYFVRHGFVLAKADVRGTGSSEGAIPDREYSNQEIDDAQEIIDFLSKESWSNGNVGMWGISWSGFNAIQTAMRRPPGLKAILAVDASDDLFKDDVHYIDGAFHADEYELSIENDLSVPRYPDYEFDADYFKNRFEQYPWFLTYHKNQQDGSFWRENSLRDQYEKINLPVFMIGGLVDGYRDSVPRMLENLSVPRKAVIGPWNHAWPDDGVPGPIHEWRDEAIKWWDRWLRGKSSRHITDPPLAVFVRNGDPPDAKLKNASGQWRFEEWPITRTDWKPFFLDGTRKLTAKPRTNAVHQLAYKPSAGVAAGFWWGEATGDMKEDDASSLVYDSEILQENMEVIGQPGVHLRVAANAKLANWIVRLEDVFPDGRVALVAGGLLNGSQRESRLHPSSLEPGKIYDIAFDLHFTTWVFQLGHKIRVAVSNAQFPMIWPTPFRMTTKLFAGTEASVIYLPVIPFENRPIPNYSAPKPREEGPFGRNILETWPKKNRIIRDLEKSTLSAEWEGEQIFVLDGRKYRVFERTFHQTNDDNPADSRFQGEAGYDIESKSRRLSVRTLIDLHSNEKFFNVVFRRQAFENGKLIREKLWTEAIPRKFH